MTSAAIIDKAKTFLNKKKLNRSDALELCGVVSWYFSNGRPKDFHIIEEKLTPRYSEILSQLTIEEGIQYTDNFFLFSYNFTDDQQNDQIPIFNHICNPYSEWLSNQNINIEFNLSSKDDNRIAFIVRHATVSGGYAPGMSTYTFVKSLLGLGYDISIICLGYIDEIFAKFCNASEHVTLYQIQEPTFKNRLQAVLQTLHREKTSLILTEIEFGIPAVLSLTNLPINIIYLSAGFYNLPWYDKIALTDTLSDNPVGNTQRYFEIPTFVDMEILSPMVDIREVKKLKNSLSITDENFVLGSFARMEKFSDEFLDFVRKILNTNPAFKIILAGPNDRTRVCKKLENFIDNKRAVILGASDVHLLGHVIDAGLDTFPNHSGFSLNEIMAKFVPVLVRWSEGIVSNWKMRDPDLIFKDEQKLLETLKLMHQKPQIYSHFAKNSHDIMLKKQKHLEFAVAIQKQIEILRGANKKLT